MSDSSQGPGWWQASDGKWYSPEQAQQPPPAATPPPAYGAPAQNYGAPAQNYGGVPPQPAPKSGNSTKILLGILGGIFLLGFLGIGGCVLLADRVVDDATTALDDFSESLEGTELGSREDPLPAGEEVDMGNGWFVTVDGADLDADEAIAGADEFNDEPPTGSRYVIVDITARFEGNEDGGTESPGIALSYSLFGSENTERDSFDVFATPPGAEFDGFSDLAPGGSTTGSEVFAVGEDEDDLVFRVESFEAFEGVTAWIELG